jgi:hypothetical protein
MEKLCQFEEGLNRCSSAVFTFWQAQRCSFSNTFQNDIGRWFYTLSVGVSFLQIKARCQAFCGTSYPARAGFRCTAVQISAAGICLGGSILAIAAHAWFNMFKI